MLQYSYSYNFNILDFFLKGRFFLKHFLIDKIRGIEIQLHLLVLPTIAVTSRYMPRNMPEACQNSAVALHRYWQKC